MEDYTLKEKLYSQEDCMTLFCLLRVSNSLIIIEEIGYAYLLGINPKSLVCKAGNPDSANNILHDNFIELRFIFKKTENNEHDKGACFEFFTVIYNLHLKLAKSITKGYELFDEVFDLLLQSPYFNEEQKTKFNEMKQQIMIKRNYNKTNLL
jgi:hypothetical protein